MDAFTSSIFDSGKPIQQFASRSFDGLSEKNAEKEKKKKNRLERKGKKREWGARKKPEDPAESLEDRSIPHVRAHPPSNTDNGQQVVLEEFQTSDLTWIGDFIEKVGQGLDKVTLQSYENEPLSVETHVRAD